MPESDPNSHLLFMMENVLKEVSKIRDIVVDLSGQRDKVESLDKRMDRVEKTLNRHSESIAVQREQNKESSPNQNPFANPAFNKALAVVVSVIIGGSVGYKGTSINQDNGDYHEHANHSQSTTD